MLATGIGFVVKTDVAHVNFLMEFVVVTGFVALKVEVRIKQNLFRTLYNEQHWFLENL